MVSHVGVDSKNLISATMSIHYMLERTLLGQTITVTLYRGRPSNDVQPDARSSQLARRLSGTTGMVGVELVSRIVLASNGFCDCTSRKGV